MGKKKLWRISALLRSKPECSVDDLRVNLRRLGIFVEDNLYEHMQLRYFGYDERTTVEQSPSSGQPNSVGGVYPVMTLASAFIADLLLDLSPRRRHVVDLVLQKLGVEKPEYIGDEDSELAGLTRTVPVAVIWELYDVLRHPNVANDVQSIEKTRQKLANDLELSADKTELRVEELLLYYLGISNTLSSDTDFELLCIRSFSLDRPRLNFEEEVERMRGSSAVVAQNRMVGQTKTHPLYTTTSSDIGKNVGEMRYTGKSYGRSQKFSASLPSHSGGATSMNM